VSLQTRLAEVLAEGVADGIFPAASAWVATPETVVAEVTAGEATADSLFDLASLTKPMVTASLAMRAVASGLLVLDEALGPGQPTVGQLLGHRAGFPAHLRFAANTPRQACEAAIWEVYDPSLGCIYTDLGYMVLGWYLEQLLGQPLERAAAEVSEARFLPTPADRRRCLPTGYSPLRQTVPLGDVHDDNCWVLGGVAGHAGLFGTAAEVGRWGQRLLRASLDRPGTPFDGGAVRRFWDLDARPDASSWVLGFDTPTPPRSSAGQFIAPDAVGHLGFTGTSVWIDRTRQLVIVLLTNRVAANAEHEAIKRFRPRFHDVVLGS